VKNCPYCGKHFNIWQRAIGEAKQHVRACPEHHKPANDIARAMNCSGCPAGCYERANFSGEHQQQ